MEIKVIKEKMEIGSWCTLCNAPIEDTEIYNQFKEYCDEEGFVVTKHLGFKIRDFLRDKNWKPLEVRKSKDDNCVEEKNNEI